MRNPIATQPGRRRQQGLTLIEVLVAAALLVILFLGTLLAFISFIRENELTAIEITANNAMRAQIEEVQAAARDNVDLTTTLMGKNGNMPVGALFYYTQFGGGQIAIGPAANPGGPSTLVDRLELGPNSAFFTYRFAVPEPGESLHATTGATRELAPSRRGFGEMRIWLDEREVPPFGGDVMWEDLGLNAAPPPARGFDMNGNGRPDNLMLDGMGFRPQLTIADLRALRDVDPLEFQALPIDITIRYFNNDTHDDEIFRVERRVVLR